MLPPSPHEKPDYGSTLPGPTRLLALAGALAIISAFLLWMIRFLLPPWLLIAAHLAFWPGLLALLLAALIFWGGRTGKLRFRDPLIADLSLRGDERVLDLGCGRGLLLLGIARRLTSGRAVGVDLWAAGNDGAITSTEENARRENVAERVELHFGDPRQIPFADGAFDIAVSFWAIHKIDDSAGRRQAISEIARVLKPGGRIVLADYRYTLEYLKIMEQLGMQGACRRGPSFLTIIPTYTLSGRKPG
jgi:arsenite methyltransferase